LIDHASRRLYMALAMISLASASSLFVGQAKAQSTIQDSSTQINSHRFTVRDSIEMARFGRVDYEPVASPDGKYFAVVTSCGHIQNNKIESTLWVFTAKGARVYLHGSEATSSFAPKIVARLAAIPNAKYDSSYEPIISNIRWTPNSEDLLFLAQNSSAKHQLYKVNVRLGSITPLTAASQDVSQFDFAGATFVYRVTEFDENPSGDPINAAARDVTGITLISILFPNIRFAQNYSTLWVNQNNRTRPVVDSRTHRPLRLWDNPPVVWNVLSISPDGKSAVILWPVKEVPEAWEHYEPHLIHGIRAKDPNTIADSNPGRLTQYAMVDLKTGQARALVNAPNAWALGYTDRNRASWSRDGKKLLLINTFLPFDGVEDFARSKRVRPCAAAMIDLTSSSTRCVSYREGRSLSASSFGKTDEEVTLWFNGETAGERFHFRNDAWQRDGDLIGEDQDLPAECDGLRANLSNGLSIQVEQNVNTPPVLSATDCRTGKHKKIWDPNPQLAKIKLGDVSEFHWKDSSGYEWTGALLKPPDFVAGKRYPLVMQSYGFVQKEFLTDGEDTTSFAARPLAGAGMMVLLFWFRFDHLGTAEEAPDQALGFQSAIEKLASEGLVDRDRVGIIGFSRTCNHVESALIKSPRLFEAATIADGADFSYLQHQLFSSGERPDEGDAIYGAKPFGEGLRSWVDHAPGFHLDRVQTPLRIEAIGPISVLTEWEIYTSLYQQKKPVDLIYISSGQHILQKPLDRMASQQGNVDWFRFWLQGEEDTDPTKKSQYVRWRQLRALCTAQVGISKVSQ
jgi:dipeptidyl aminopeptidase/acylaminoacyl peptidase